MQTNTKEKEQSASVSHFFDGHSSDYKNKYRGSNKFYEYFFFERLRKTTKGIDFDGKNVLDIGAGTGALYDWLVESNSKFATYTATDIASKMLEVSNIPEEHRIVGDILDIEFKEKYDFIYMLGVSTYFSSEKMTKYLVKIRNLLNEDGVAVITFTNNHSLDIILRKLLGPLIKLFSKKNRVLTQNFETHFYSKKEVMEMCKSTFEVKDVRGLNHTFFPLSRGWVSFSVFLAKKLSQLSENNIKFFLSSDLVFFLK